MASHPRLVLEDLLTALRVDHGDVDLSTSSGTPKVVVADRPFLPVRPPYMSIAAPSVAFDNNGANLKQRHVTGRIEWYLHVPSELDTAESRALAAMDAAAAVVDAIHDAHEDSTYTTLFALPILLASIDDVFGDEPEVSPGCGVVQGSIVYEAYLARAGS